MLTARAPRVDGGRALGARYDAPMATRETPEVTLRPALPEDVELVFRWANDPATRAASFKPAPIAHAEHVAWFEAQLARPDRHLRIATREGVPFGFLRLDRDADAADRCTLSVNLAPEARGCGLGARALRAATTEAGRLGFRAITALVRPENEASVRAFLRAGYAEHEPTRVEGVPARRFVRDTTPP